MKLVKKILSVPKNHCLQRSCMYILQLPNCLLDDRCKANPLPPLMRKQETKSQPQKKKPMMKQHTHLFGRREMAASRGLAFELPSSRTRTHPFSHPFFPSLLPSLPLSLPLFVPNFPCNRQDPRPKPDHKSFQHITTSTPTQRREESSRSSSSVALAYFPASLAETQGARERAFPLHNLLLLVLLQRQAPPVSNFFSNIYTCRRFDCSRVSEKRIFAIKVSSVLVA